jgi:Arc/MetJ family transcription regulator
MRTNVEIDDALMRKAMRASGQKTKRATIEAGLEMLVRVHAQTGIRKLFGKVEWVGDLEQSRRTRTW